MMSVSAAPISSPIPVSVCGVPVKAGVGGRTGFTPVHLDPEIQGHATHGFRPQAASAPQMNPAEPCEEKPENGKGKENGTLERIEIRHACEQQDRACKGRPDNAKDQLSHIAPIAQKSGEKVTHV